MNVQKVLWFLEELGIDWEHIPAGGSFGRLQNDEFGLLNPNRLVPVLEDGALVVWESHTILRYLAGQYGGERWWPSNAAIRSLGERWMDWCQTTWQPAFLNGVFWGYYRTPESQRNNVAISESIKRCSKLMILINDQLVESKYLCGFNLGVGEIPIATSLFRYFELDIERPAIPMVEEWYARLQERKPFKEYTIVSFEELKWRLSF